MPNVPSTHPRPKGPLRPPCLSKCRPEEEGASPGTGQRSKEEHRLPAARQIEDGEIKLRRRTQLSFKSGTECENT